jgi:hypothetical protein
VLDELMHLNATPVTSGTHQIGVTYFPEENASGGLYFYTTPGRHGLTAENPQSGTRHVNDSDWRVNWAVIP